MAVDAGSRGPSSLPGLTIGVPCAKCGVASQFDLAPTPDGAYDGQWWVADFAEPGQACACALTEKEQEAMRRRAVEGA